MALSIHLTPLSDGTISVSMPSKDRRLRGAIWRVIGPGGDFAGIDYETLKIQSQISGMIEVAEGGLISFIPQTGFIAFDT